MPAAFSRTLRSLEADGHRRSLWALLLTGLLLAGASGWFFFARVAVYETTDRARLEVERAAHPFSTPVAGRVAATHLAPGRTVQPGDLLVELDSETERLQLEDEKSRLGSTLKRREALREQTATEDQAWPEEKKAAALAIDEARARLSEAEAAAKLAEDGAARAKQLARDQLVSQAELLRAETEVQKQRAVASAQALTISKLESEAKSKQNNHEVRRAQLQREAASLDGEIRAAEGGIQRFEHVVEQRRIRAPVAGELGEAAELRPGTFVTEGQKLGAIIPTGQLKLVAQFSPFTALGRLRPGQSARLRLDGFPWAQYGSVVATVTSVAAEPRDGQLRGELSVRPDSVPAIALQHGLSGTVEVQVERVSPATLVLRAAGKLVGAPRPVGVLPAAGQEGKP